jgi:hypothetical protein
VTIEVESRWLQKVLMEVGDADPKSLQGMREALAVTLVYLTTRDGEGDTRMSQVIPSLKELRRALTLVALGEHHPELKPARARGRSYTATKRRFIADCLECSDALVASGLQRREADLQVRKWARKQAALLRIPMSSKEPFKYRRRRSGRPRQNPFKKMFGPAPVEPAIAKFWVYSCRRQIENFDAEGQQA